MRRLVAAALGLGAVLPSRADAAPAMVSQLAAAYQSTPKGMFSCGVCTFFIKPTSCKVVTGAVSPRIQSQAAENSRRAGWRRSPA